jgi:hypothetical protein
MPRSKVQYSQENWNVDNKWNVRVGELRPVGRKSPKANPLFKYVAEKLPWEALPFVSKYLKDHKVKRVGVYMAHDSLGWPGMGAVATSLVACGVTKGNTPESSCTSPFISSKTKRTSARLRTSSCEQPVRKWYLTSAKYETELIPGGSAITSRGRNSSGANTREVRSERYGSRVADVSKRSPDERGDIRGLPPQR